MTLTTNPTARLAREIADAKAWLRDHGHTLDCGEQDAAGDRIADLTATLSALEGAPTRNRDHAAAAVETLTAAGRHATLWRHAGRYVAIDLDGPFVEIVDLLLEIGLECEAAEDVAWHLVNRDHPNVTD